MTLLQMATSPSLLGARTLKVLERTAAFFTHTRGPQTTSTFREKIQISLRRFQSFSAVDAQTAVLVSTAKAWISAPDA